MTSAVDLVRKQKMKKKSKVFLLFSPSVVSVNINDVSLLFGLL